MISNDQMATDVAGEVSGDIRSRGKQWAVTNRGVKALDGSYPILAARSLENFNARPWPIQLSEKNWVDGDDFATTLRVALVLPGYANIDSRTFRSHLARMALGSDSLPPEFDLTV